MQRNASGISVQGTFHARFLKPNEDRIVVIDARDVYAAIDGVGGDDGSAEAAACVEQALAAMPDEPPNRETLLRAFGMAEDLIEELHKRTQYLKCPRALATAAWLREVGENLEGFIAHVGDTNGLLIDHDAETIVQLTTPHEKMGNRRMEVTRYVGGRTYPPPDILPVVVPPNRTLLLVTDGVTKRLSLNDIRMKALYTATPQELVLALVQMAQNSGETDDISVVAVRTYRS